MNNFTRALAVLFLIFSNPVIGAELTALDLLHLCNSKDDVSKSACRFFVLGVSNGLTLGQHLTKSPEKKLYFSYGKSILCVPPDVPASQLSSIFVDTATVLNQAHLSDLDTPAVSIVAAALLRKYGCAAESTGVKN